MKREWNVFNAFWMGLAFLIGCTTVDAQTITVTSPKKGADWFIGYTHTIMWTKTGAQEPLARIRLRDQSGNTLVLKIAEGVSNTGIYNWTIPATVAPGQYRIRVRTTLADLSDGAIYDDSEVFNIKIHPPAASISVTSPTVGDNWFKGNSHIITWTKSGPMAANVNIYLRNKMTNSSVATIASNASNSGNRQWRIPDTLADGEYYLYIMTTDNLVINTSHFFWISGKPDLVVCIEWDGKAAKVFKDKRVHFRVINRAQSKSGPCMLNVYMEKYGDKRMAVPALAPGGEYVCSIKKSWPSTGNKTIRATIDCDNVVHELNESNNMVQKNLYVHALGGDEYTLEVKDCSDD